MAVFIDGEGQEWVSAGAFDAVVSSREEDRAELDAARRELSRFEHVHGEPVSDMAAVAEVAYGFVKHERDSLREQRDNLERRVALLEREPTKDSEEVAYLADQVGWEPGQQRRGGLPGEESSPVDAALDAISDLADELHATQRERDDWRNAHGSVVAAKRRLGEKYGRIMRWHPRAVLTRIRKWPRRAS